MQGVHFIGSALREQEQGYIGSKIYVYWNDLIFGIDIMGDGLLTFKQLKN